MPVRSCPKRKWPAAESTARVQSRLALVQERSRAFNKVLGIDGPLQSFDLPPPRPAQAEPSTGGLGEPLFGNSHDLSEQKHPASYESLAASRMTTSVVRLEDDGLWTGAVTDVVELLNLRSPLKLNEKRKGLSNHPERGKYHLSVFRVELPAVDLNDYDSGDGMDLDDNETEVAAGAPTPKLPYRYPLSYDHFAGGGGDDKQHPLPHANNVSPNTFTALYNNDNNNPSITVPQDPFPLLSKIEPLNVFPHLEKLLEQWIRFGDTHSDALRLLSPRKITINSIMAKTLPKARPRSDPKASPKKLFAIQAEDVLELSMYEFEVLPAQDGTLLNSIYHETSALNPNIWTVLFIREKTQRVGDASAQGPVEAGHVDPDGDSNMARKRHAQESNVEMEAKGEPHHHPWQIVAWPSAHVTKFFEVLVPVPKKLSDHEKSDGNGGECRQEDTNMGETEEKATRPTNSQNKTATAPSLGRKVAQVRRPRQCEGRTHLKDVQSYARYKSLAQTRAGGQFSCDGIMKNFQQKNSQQSFRQRTDSGQTQQNTNDTHNNTVSGEEKQRLTSLQFYRGGSVPLLSADGVDLAYWHSFCHHFGKGDLQLDILSPVDDGPVMLPGQEYLLRRFRPTGGLRGSDYDVGGGTPIPSKNIHGADKMSLAGIYSMPSVQIRESPLSSGLRFALQAQNIGAHINPPFPILPQHSRNHSSQKSTVHLNPLEVQTGQSHHEQPTFPFTPTSAEHQSAALQNHESSAHHPNDDQQSPLVRGWQTEVLAALAESRQPAWRDWTERSPVYQARQAKEPDTEQRLADRLIDAEQLVMSDFRCARDGDNPFVGQRIQMAQRVVERERERYLEFLAEKKRLEAEKRGELVRRQQKQMKELQAAQHKRAVCTLRATGLAEEAVKMGQEFVGAVEEGDSDDDEDDERT